MKKILIILLCLFTTDSFSSGIASNSASAPCTNNTLETYSGNSNLAADWQPNEINLRWYNGNTLMNVQSSANTCVYDGTLTIPQNAPTRTGYTFAGWTVQPEYDFSTLPTNEGGTESYSIGNVGWCTHYVGGVYIESWDTCTVEGLNDLTNGEWKTIFSWGTLYGMSMCSSTSGTNGDIGNPVESSDGWYCWCKATGYVPHGTNTKYAPISAGWVFQSKSLGASNNNLCQWVCPSRCGTWITEKSFYQTQLNGLLGVQ